MARINVVISDQILETIEKIAECQGISKSEVIRKAIATEFYFLKERQNGSKVMLLDSNKEIREVIFR